MYCPYFLIQLCGTSFDKLFWKKKYVLDMSHLETKLYLDVL